MERRTSKADTTSRSSACSMRPSRRWFPTYAVRMRRVWRGAWRTTSRAASAGSGSIRSTMVR
eukprot:54861-Eustigmatos_ZCMA.PRE.1